MHNGNTNQTKIVYYLKLTMVNIKRGGKRGEPRVGSEKRDEPRVSVHKIWVEKPDTEKGGRCNRETSHLEGSC